MTETAAAIAFNPGRGTPVAGSVGFRAPYSETRIVRLGLGRSGPLRAGRERARAGARAAGLSRLCRSCAQCRHARRRRLADHRRCRLPDRGRTPRPDRPREGPDHPQRPQHRSGRDRGRGQPVSPACRSAPRSACRTSMPARFRRCSSCRARRCRSISRRCRRHLDGNVHEPPARPKSVLVIDALPVTAVGKIFKPALRDLAIKEKVRLERRADLRARRIGNRRCLDSTSSKHTLVEVVVAGATWLTRSPQLEAALKPLPQTYVCVRDAEPARLVTLDIRGRHRDADPQPAREPERRLRSDDAVAGAAAPRPWRTCRTCASCIITGSGPRLLRRRRPHRVRGGAARPAGRSCIDTLRYNQDVLQLVEDLPVPVIGAANGAAVAGGLELLLCCDIIIAAEDAKIGDGHARYGIVPAGGATVRLVERIVRRAPRSSSTRHLWSTRRR